MSLTNLSSGQLTKLVELIKAKEHLQAQVARVSVP
jgi:hypothetical protein